MKKNKKRESRWQPVVADMNGGLRDRFDRVCSKTGIKKASLSAKIFDVGLSQLERTLK